MRGSSKKPPAEAGPSEFYGIRIPSPETLKKHGLDVKSWKELAKRSGYACHICLLAGRPNPVPPSKILNIDHQHVPRYYKMPPEKKRLYHRGLLCYQHNRLLLQKGVTSAVLEAASDYLFDYQLRKEKLDVRAK